MGGQANESFSHIDGLLVRDVVPARGKPYRHTCTRDVYHRVAWAIEECEDQTFTGGEIIAGMAGRGEHAPFTQVMVAYAFMKERGVIIPAMQRRQKAAGSAVHEDAMIEWHALLEEPEAAM